MLSGLRCKFFLFKKEGLVKGDILTGPPTLFILDTFAKLTNKKSKGFRAPTFSINTSTAWALDILYEKNYFT